MKTETATLKIGQHRGSPRLWIEGARLTRAGFEPGERVAVRFVANEGGGPSIVITSADPNNAATHTISKRERGGRTIPILDCHDQAFAALGPRVSVLFAFGLITITRS
jgi:DNA (cytosine-5)-methyltransferase 1